MRSEDFTGQGILEDAFSYDRPAWIVGNALINGFIEAGLTKEQAINLFYSKATRWALDGSLGEALTEISYKLGKQIAKDWAKEPFLNEPLFQGVQDALDMHNDIERMHKASSHV
jgi:hypothetical protein